jgi:hypothetical protein
MKLYNRLWIIAALLLGNFMIGTWYWAEESQHDFSNLHTTTLPEGANPRIVDLALLGAHDAFSHAIELWSDIDPDEPSSSLLRQVPLRVLLPGVLVRYAKTQSVGTEALLKAGVRYFDIRLSYHRGQWMTKHGFIADTLASYMLPLLTFLHRHPGEFVILDFQHIYFADQTPQLLIEALQSISFEQTTVWDYVHVATTKAIGELRYEEVSNQRTQAGAVLLLPFDASISEFRHYPRNLDNIRSTWHNTASMSTLLTKIDQESSAVLSLGPKQTLVVNQAQRTGVFSGSEIGDTLLGWSLLAMARHGNLHLIDHPNFRQWLSALPIVMVDYATSDYQQFNTRIHTIFNEYNAQLS